MEIFTLMAWMCQNEKIRKIFFVFWVIWDRRMVIFPRLQVMEYLEVYAHAQGLYGFGCERALHGGASDGAS